MNIVFFGSSQFAAPSLRALSRTSHKILCVVTQPDRKKGRGLHLASTIIKSESGGLGLEVYQPERVNTDEAAKLLQGLNPDLFVVISYGQILSRRILQIPKIFAINVHASLLPKYRGAAPINWTIIKGDKTTGVTILKMTERMDAGPVILQRKLDIHDGETAATLESSLSDVAAESLIDSIKLIQDNNYNLTPQDESKISFAPKLKKKDGLIDWSKPAGDIDNLIRGCISWPGAFTYYHGKLLKIYRVSVQPDSGLSVYPSPGEITQVSSKGIVVVTGKGNLIITELQMEGKKMMQVREFIAGHRIIPGDRLGLPAY